jgi:hypothetical protein
MYRTNVVAGTWALNDSELTLTARSISNNLTAQSEPFSSTQTHRVGLRGGEMVWLIGQERLTLKRFTEARP